MTDIEQFRTETRAWLEANCPPSMRTPGGEEEAVWGGRNATFANRSQAESVQIQETCTDCHASGGFKGVDIVHGQK